MIQLLDNFPKHFLNLANTRLVFSMTRTLVRLPYISREVSGLSAQLGYE
jgi:hypothetical protein